MSSLADVAAETELALWAQSGAMALTGRAGQAPRATPHRIATLAHTELERFSTAASHWALNDLPPLGSELLGERAAIAGLRRNGPRSCGNAFAMTPTADGWLGLSLARPEDIELVPALVMKDVHNNPWQQVCDWASTVSSHEADERMALLNLPGGAIERHGAAGEAATIAIDAGLRTPRRRPRVIDFTALWAGPLCAHLLAQAGADVIKVESIHRPDGARQGPRHFFDLLHGGHRSIAVDPHDPSDTARLRALVLDADLVLEASRPHALRRWGLNAEDIVHSGVTWISITARGRDSNRVGFGDDLAAAAGLVLYDDEPMPCADALADPLSGIVAARAAAEALASHCVQLIDISMIDVCRSARGTFGDRPLVQVTRSQDGRWHANTENHSVEVLAPRARPPRSRAPRLGQHNGELLR